MLNKIVLFLLLLIIVEESIANPASGTLSGKVLDMMSKQPIPGVNVVILNTTLGTSTNLDGEYFIENIPVGTYQV
ncbi:MAG: carboxypeptidase-like regulatory domain-containing protein, partial [Ignavibacteria bacterium]|nr:carboxypeptidase-like regulatory domain-containing protein [Ignavibacteria bacterium]